MVGLAADAVSYLAAATDLRNAPIPMRHPLWVESSNFGPLTATRGQVGDASQTGHWHLGCRHCAP